MSEVTVTIFDRDYRLAVTSGEEDLIRECAKSVDDQMQAIRSAGRVIGNDQIAVLAALELAYDAKKARETPEGGKAEADPNLAEIRSLCKLCEEALYRETKMGSLF